MEVLVSEFQDIFSNWKFVGAFEQSFDPGLDQIEIPKIYLCRLQNLWILSQFSREFT